MGRGGRVDLRQLKAFERKLAKLARADFEKFCEAAAKELAARMLREVKNNTNVITGYLRNNWTIDANIRKVGGVFEIDVYNPTEYSSYYEYGHRTRNHKGWVKGRFTMTIAADKIEGQAPAILERKLFNMLKEAFNGD